MLEVINAGGAEVLRQELQGERSDTIVMPKIPAQPPTPKIRTKYRRQVGNDTEARDQANQENG